jgi:rare lipoprotein A
MPQRVLLAGAAPLCLSLLTNKIEFRRLGVGGVHEAIPGKLLKMKPKLCFVPAAALLFAAGCQHQERTAQLPQPQAAPPVVYPAQRQVAPEQTPSQPQLQPVDKIPITPVPPGGVSAEDLAFVARHKPIAAQVGFATWYTASKGRKAANGELFDESALTAAHRTLPMGTLIVVTNLETGQSSAMRIADRGPFVTGRILDLTPAAAKATGVYGKGMSQVRIDVYQTPKPIKTGGRWCVQIGAFRTETLAIHLKEELLRTYAGSNVIEFPGENSYWVRIRPQGDDREMAEHIAHHLHPVEGEAFLTRLD